MSNILKQIENIQKNNREIKAICDNTNVMLDNIKNGLEEDTQKQFDEAYQKGFNEGKEYGLDEADMREAVSYQKGLADAWETARKILICESDGGYSWKELQNIFGTDKPSKIYIDNTAVEAINKIKIYEEQKNDNEIKVGDEVESLYNDGTVIEGMIPWVVIKIQEVDGEKYYYGIDAEGSLRNNDFVRKTGRHFGIEKILEEMNGRSDY